MKTAIMGFGNPVRSDDAVGVYVIEQLQKKVGDTPDITLFDMGTSAFEVLFGLKGHDCIFMVDAVVNSGEKVGTVFKVPAKELMTEPKNDPMVFLHSLKWDQALSYAKKIMRKDFPVDITVFLIAVENIRMEIGLSNVVLSAGNRVINEILATLEDKKQNIC